MLQDRSADPLIVSRRQALGAIAVGLAPGFARAADTASQALPEREEAPLLPDLPIVDAHHHLRDYAGLPGQRPPYRAETFLADIRRSGHRIVETVFLEASTMYRTDGPEALRSVGETAYVNEVAARLGTNSTCRLAGGIVAKIDLRLGDRVPELIAAHEAAAGGRLRGVRNSIAWDAYGPYSRMNTDPDLLDDAAFRRGLAALAPAGLSLDIWLLHPQIPRVTALARAFPDTTIVVNHLGNPLLVGPYADRRDEVFAAWSANMADLARCPNVVVKIGGLPMFMSETHQRTTASAGLARAWRPWIEKGIDLFGVHRCMFESNYPADAPAASYGAIWNAFKRIAGGLSTDERTALFSGTARRVYRLPS